MTIDLLGHLTGVTQFPPSSRYYQVEIAEIVAADGRKLKHLRRRFVPPPESFQTVMQHVVREGERLDQIAATYLGDSEQFWKICDANVAFVPVDLTDTPGRALFLTLPEDFPKTSANA